MRVGNHGSDKLVQRFAPKHPVQLLNRNVAAAAYKPSYSASMPVASPFAAPPTAAAAVAVAA